MAGIYRRAVGAAVVASVALVGDAALAGVGGVGFAAGLVARLLDPVLFIPAICAGLFLRRFWHLVVVAAALGVTHEALLTAMQAARAFSPMGVLAADLVALSVAALIWSVRRGVASVEAEGRERP